MTETEGFAPDIPVSGRDTPRPAPLPDDFRHDVRFWAKYDIERDVVIVAECIPCDWGVTLDGGHDLADLTRLVAMHEGIPDAPDHSGDTLPGPEGQLTGKSKDAAGSQERGPLAAEFCGDEFAALTDIADRGMPPILVCRNGFECTQRQAAAEAGKAATP